MFKFALKFGSKHIKIEFLVNMQNLEFNFLKRDLINRTQIEKKFGLTINIRYPDA